MKTIKSKLLAVGVAGLFSANAFADADIAVQPAGTQAVATTNVDLCIVVPNILIFGLGAVGDVVNEIKWTVGAPGGMSGMNNQTYSGTEGAFTAPDPFDVGSITTQVTGDNGTPATETTTNVASLEVFLFSNSGQQVTITPSFTGGTNGDATNLGGSVMGRMYPVNTITLGDGGTLDHPALGSPATVGTANMVTNLADNWTYTFAPTMAAGHPIADTYTGTITYVAATP